jgi:hypothetical protein
MVVVVGVISAALTTLSWEPQLRRTLRRGTATDFAWTYLLMLGAGLQTGTYSRQAIAGAIAGDWSVQVDPAHRIGQRRSRERAHH